MTFKHHVILTEIAIIYFVICYPVSLLAGYLEHRLKKRRGPRRGSWSAALRRIVPGLTRA